MVFRSSRSYLAFLILEGLISFCLPLLISHNKEADAAPRSSKRLQTQILHHQEEYQRLRRLWLLNKSLEKKYLDQGYDLKFKVLELQMNKEQLHMRLEQNHLQEIRFSRDLEKLNRSIRRERLSLKSHRRKAVSLKGELISQSVKNYLFKVDASPDTLEDVMGLLVSEQAYSHVQKKIESDRFHEASTSVKMEELSRRRRKMLKIEAMRRSEEAQEETEMGAIRLKIADIQAREKGIEEKNKIIYTKTRHLLKLIHHLEIVNKHRLANRHAFSPVHLRLRGLNWPVRGKIVEPFGKFHDGIDILASDGTSVLSAEAGRVLFARHYAGYGKLVIVNHGRHVYSLYGHLKSINVREGAFVHKGDRLGIAGGGGTNGRSTLFFGLTHRGTPVNPVPYLAH